MRHLPSGFSLNTGDLYHYRTDITSLTAGQTSILMLTPPYNGIVEVWRTEPGLLLNYAGQSIAGSGPRSRLLTASEAVYSASLQTVTIPATGVGEIYTVDFWSKYPLVAAPALSTLNSNAQSLWSKVVAWYELDETSGTTMNDAHTGAYNGTYNSAASINQTGITANTGLSVSLSGTGGSAALNSFSVPNSVTALNTFGNDFAQMVWFKPASNSSADNGYGGQTVVSRGSGGGTGFTTYWLTWADPAAAGAGGTGLLFYRITKAVTQYDLYSTSTISAGNTYMLGAQRVGGTGSEIWINGVRDSLRGSIPTGSADNTTASATFIGALEGVGATYTNAKGNFGQVVFFNTSLTSGEWGYLYNGGAGVSYATFKAQSGH